jgi:methionine biosynthesis protein MetW
MRETISNPLDNHPEINRWILAHTPEGGKVLDIGCGEGELLGRMVSEKKVQGTGIEISQDHAVRAIQRGLTVHHGNVEEGLDHYGDKGFDLVVLSLTLQETRRPRQVLLECFRVGRQVIVVFPNFGHWRSRWQLGWHGRAPRTTILPYPWYESPNYHYITIADWEDFCRDENWKILNRGFAAAGKAQEFLPRWRAEVAMYLLEG